MSGFKLESKIPQTTAAMRREASRIVRGIAFAVEGAAKTLAPVDTGALRNSITTTVGDNGMTAEVGPTVEYAIYQELGTHKMAPRPFLGPAFEQMRGPFNDAVKKLVK